MKTVFDSVKYLLLSGCITVTSSVAAQDISSALTGRSKINIGEVFVKSNIPQCVELQFEGFAIFAKISASIFTGISVRIIGSPITSHYNPDFTVAAYPRLGTSPLLESFVVFGPVQNAISKPVVELLTGLDVPDSYDNFDEWGMPGTETKDRDSKSVLKYYETEVIGHPGNLYTAASRAMNGQVPIALDQIGNAILEIPRQLAQAPGALYSSARQMANGVTNLGVSFPDLNGGDFSPVEWARDLFIDDIATVFDRLPTDVVGSISNLASSTTADAGELLSRATDAALNINVGDGIRSATDTVLGAIEPCPEGETCTNPITAVANADFSQLPDYVEGELTEYFSSLTPVDILEVFAPSLAEDVQDVFEVVGALRDFQAFSAGSTDSAGGIAARFEPWKGLCPSDTFPMVPYFLSGMNVPGWRFKIPELVYPQTYVPFSNATTIGNIFPGDDGERHNYGSVYPRNGYLMQSDALKAASVASFRAAHIVTHSGQPYLYRYAAPLRHSKYYMFDGRNEDLDFRERNRESSDTELRPDMEERGRWQLIHSRGGDKDKSCHSFGDPEVNPKIESVNPGGLLQGQIDAITGRSSSAAPQWTEGKVSEDHQYVFNLWRRYRCAPDPDTGGSYTRHMFNINIPRITVIGD